MRRLWRYERREAHYTRFSSRNGRASPRYSLGASPRCLVAVYHLKVSVGSRGGGHSAVAKSDYVERESRYSEATEGERGEVAHREHGHLPAWAGDEARRYWAAADTYERANGGLYREVQFALPKELPEGEQIRLASSFAQDLTARERLPYTLAVHRGGGENPHAHLVISERANDGITRDAAQWFKRHNAAAPERGGARKSRTMKPRDWLVQTREAWAQRVNRALEVAGRVERVDHRSLAARATEAYAAGDFERAATLSREPGVHLGPTAIRQAAQPREHARFHQVARAEQVETRNATGADRWSDFNRELERIQQQIVDRMKELRQVEQRIREITQRMIEQTQTWARGPERDSGPTR